MNDLENLVMLIKILKAEGVATYSGLGHSLAFHASTPEQPLPEMELSVLAESKKIPEHLRGLNPNYLHPALGLNLDDL